MAGVEDKAGIVNPVGQRARNRVSLTNLETGERMRFVLNPTELGESVTANYDQPVIPGMSQTPLRYKNTSAMVWDLDLYANMLIVATAHALDFGAAREAVEEMRRFLLSLTIPSRKYEGFIGGAPPLALFAWPSVVVSEVKVTSVRFTLEQFKPDLTLMAYKASVQLVECRDARKWSEDVRVSGSLLWTRPQGA